MQLIVRLILLVIMNQLSAQSDYWIKTYIIKFNNRSDTNYYPSSTGMSMDGYKDFSLSGKFIDADGTMTLSIEATNDEDTTNADWIDISLLGIDSKTGINKFLEMNLKLVLSR